VGGNETTRNVITGGLEAMIRNPEQMAIARRSPEDLERAIEECLRWVTPIINMVRVTTEDVEIRGVKIPKGSQVIMNYTAANRDEDMFVEPHTFDVTRSPNPHIAFGWGPHLCLGASLARLELRSIYTELFKQTNTIEFTDPNYQPVYSHASFVRGIQSLPVKFS
jgi:cytochrome P450 family 142 subfamily A polypeptide 1